MNSEWREVRLGDVATTLNGAGIKQEFFAVEGIPLARVSNFASGTIDLSDCIFVDRQHAQRWGSHRINFGDVIVATVGSWPPNWSSVVGKVVRAPVSAVGALQNQNTCRVVAREDVTDQRFLYYLLSTQEFVLFAANAAAGSANQARLGVSSLEKFSFSLPSLAEQQEIGEFLGALDDRITLLRETNATLEAIAQALFKSWFVDFEPVHAKVEGRQPEGLDASTAALFPDSFEESELGLVPKGWRVIPFLDVCDLQGGAQPPASTFIEEPRDGYVRLLQIRDFSTDNHKTYIPDTKKLKKVTEDDVLIGRYGSASGDKAKDSLGRVCRGLSGSYNVALMKLSPVQVGKEYAFQLVSDPAFYGYLQGVSSKAVQSGFSKNELGQYKVVLPPSEITEYFEQFGEITWFRIKENRKQAQTLTQLRDILLPRLISGQLRLPDAGQAVEEALA